MHHPSYIPSQFACVILLLIAMLTVQSGASLAKHIFPAVGPEGACALRLGFSALALCAWWRPWRIRLTRTQACAVILYGLAIGGMNLLIYLAITRIPLGIAVALEFTGPLAVSLFASRKPQDVIWVILAATGIVLLLPASPFSTALDPVGILYAFGAGACWAIYILAGRKAGSSLPSGIATALGITAGAIFITPIGIAAAGEALLAPNILLFGLAIAMLSSALPFSLEMLVLKHMPLHAFGILMSIEPAIGALSGLLFLHEHLNLAQYAAIGCIILASTGSTVSARQ